MENINNLHVIHRGSYSYKYPENSIPAFREALSKKIMIELDIHILKDDTVVVFHDDNLLRMCDVDLNIKDLTYEEISKFRLKDTIYTIPTLQEILDVVGGYVNLDIELKYDVLDDRFTKKVIEILKEYKGKYFLKSFHPKIVRQLKKLRRKNKMNFCVGLLLTNKSYSIPLVILTCPDFISFNYKNLNKKGFRLLSKYKPTLLYTIKNKMEYESIKNFNGGYILENYETIFK